MVKILVKKFDKNIKLPTYKTSGSSGMDLVAYIKNKLTINPGKIAKVILVQQVDKNLNEIYKKTNR